MICNFSLLPPSPQPARARGRAPAIMFPNLDELWTALSFTIVLALLLCYAYDVPIFAYIFGSSDSSSFLGSLLGSTHGSYGSGSGGASLFEGGGGGAAAEEERKTPTQYTADEAKSKCC